MATYSSNTTMKFTATRYQVNSAGAADIHTVGANKYAMVIFGVVSSGTFTVGDGSTVFDTISSTGSPAAGGLYGSSVRFWLGPGDKVRRTGGGMNTGTITVVEYENTP